MDKVWPFENTLRLPSPTVLGATAEKMTFDDTRASRPLNISPSGIATTCSGRIQRIGHKNVLQLSAAHIRSLQNKCARRTTSPCGNDIVLFFVRTLSSRGGS